MSEFFFVFVQFFCIRTNLFVFVQNQNLSCCKLQQRVVLVCQTTSLCHEYKKNNINFVHQWATYYCMYSNSCALTERLFLMINMQTFLLLQLKAFFIKFSKTFLKVLAIKKTTLKLTQLLT